LSEVKPSSLGFCITSRPSSTEVEPSWKPMGLDEASHAAAAKITASATAPIGSARLRKRTRLEWRWARAKRSSGLVMSVMSKPLPGLANPAPLSIPDACRIGRSLKSSFLWRRFPEASVNEIFERLGYASNMVIFRLLNRGRLHAG